MANEAEKTGTGGKNGQNFWNGEQFLSLLFPRRCPVCGEIVLPRGELICPACVGKLTLVRQPVCMTCGKELESERQEYCVDCMRHPKTFRHNFALLRYDDVTRRSMAAIKYKNKREYLDFYGEAMARRFGRQLLRIRPDALVPVPVHRSRLRSRGFNQAQLLAERIGRRLAAGPDPHEKDASPEKAEFRGAPGKYPESFCARNPAGKDASGGPDRRYLHHRQHSGGLRARSAFHGCGGGLRHDHLHRRRILTSVRGNRRKSQKNQKKIDVSLFVCYSD